MTYYKVMKTVNIGEFKAHINRYISEAERGNEVLIARRNIPIARLVSDGHASRRNKTRLGRFKETGRIHGDIVSPAMDSSEWENL